MTLLPVRIVNPILIRANTQSLARTLKPYEPDAQLPSTGEVHQFSPVWRNARSATFACAVSTTRPLRLSR